MKFDIMITFRKSVVKNQLSLKSDNKNRYFTAKHCATSRKVAGLIPDAVIGFFRLHNPSGRTMDLESTQPLTEMSTRNVSWG